MADQTLFSCTRVAENPCSAPQFKEPLHYCMWCPQVLSGVWKKRLNICTFLRHPATSRPLSLFPHTHTHTRIGPRKLVTPLRWNVNVSAMDSAAGSQPLSHDKISLLCGGIWGLESLLELPEHTCRRSVPSTAEKVYKMCFFAQMKTNER